MATQISGFPLIYLNVGQSFQNVRLLEVPDEILDIIAQGEGLRLLSSPTSITKGLGKEGNLHLCSKHKVWLVKQVSTSNSLYITQTEVVEQNNHSATNGTGHNEGEDTPMNGLDETMSQPTSRVTVISKPANILELYPVLPSSYEATIQEHLDRLVPTLDKTFEDNLPPTPASSYSLLDLYADIPAPTSTINKILSEKVVDVYWDGNIYMPTPNLLLETWKRLVGAATAYGPGAEIDEIFLVGKLLNTAFDDGEFESRTDTGDIFKAIARNWTRINGLFEQYDLFTMGKNQNPYQRFKPTDTARWVGNLVLRAAQEEGVELEKDAFVAKWEDVVPAVWMKYCSVEVLEPACVVVKQDDGREIVQWRSFKSGAVPRDEPLQVVDGHSKPAAAAMSSGKNKRKWHEKFAAQRNAKK